MMKVHTGAALISGSTYVIAEDWPTQSIATAAAILTAGLLQPDSGYAGKHEVGAPLEEYVAGLFDIKDDTPYGCTLHLATVTPDF